MKILLLHDNPPPGAGAEKQFLGLRDELRKRGHDARLFTSTAGKQASRFSTLIKGGVRGGLPKPYSRQIPQPPPDLPLHKGEDIRNSTASGSFTDYECFGTTSRFRTILQSCNPWAYSALKKVLADFQPDIVQANIYLTQLSPLILRLLRNIPTIYYAVWYRTICPLGTKMLPDRSTCFYPAGRICLRTGCLPLRDWIPLMYQMKTQRRWQGVFDLVVAVSESVRLRLVAEGVPATEVNWPGVALQKERPEKSPTPLVVFAGRLVKEKGCDILLQAFANVKRQVTNARLLIAGDGPDQEQLKQMAGEFQINSSVTFTGKISPEEVQQHFAPAWVQAVPSVWPEPLPIAAMEAMMNGTVVVASKIGGLPEIISDGITGFLVEPGNHEQLAQAIVRAFNNRELTAKIGRASHDFAVNHLTEDKSVERFVTLYERVLHRQGLPKQG